MGSHKGSKRRPHRAAPTDTTCNSSSPTLFNNYYLPLSMTDVHDLSTRSFNMSRIKGKNTRPEMLVRKFLFANGFRYRLHVKNLPGHPDIVLPKYKTVIFVNGCFWHGHKGCRFFVLPKTRTPSTRGNFKRSKPHGFVSRPKYNEYSNKTIVSFENLN